MKDYYGILEVNPNASKEIIEKAYKTLVKKYHPDLYSSVEKKEAEKKLKDINEAYNILSDSFLRSQYDLEIQKEKNSARINESRTRDNIKTNEIDINKTNTSKNQKNNSQNEHVRKRSNVGTLFGIIELIKDLWANKPEKRERKKMNQTDWLAVGLTIVALIIIGIILWFIPFTNGWMRQLLFENPIFKLIGSLFS